MPSNGYEPPTREIYPAPHIDPLTGLIGIRQKLSGMRSAFQKDIGMRLLAVATFAFASTSFAQGTIDFTNIKTPGRPRMFLCDPLTQGTSAIEGPNYLIDLLVKNPASGNYEGVLKNGAPFTGVSPLTGANAGLFSGGILVVPFVAPDAKADVKIRIWDVTSGATYNTALYKSEAAFSIDRLGGAGSPPTLPATLANLTTFVMCPEPSTYALGGLGLGLVVLQSLRTNRRKG